MSDVNPSIIDFKKHNPSELLLPRPPILSTYTARWDGFVFEHHCQPAGESDEVSIINGHAVLIFTHKNKQVHAERKLDGKLRDDPVQEGDVIIIPQGVGHGVRAFDEAEFFALVMAPTNFESQLIPHFATSDPLLYQIGLAMKTVLENDLTGSRLYAETMVNAVTVYLTQHYATKKPILHNYNVINCRVTRAKELLQKGESISQVAQQVGFANQSHLNLHFVRQFGATPKQILKNR